MSYREATTRTRPRRQDEDATRRRAAPTTSPSDQPRRSRHRRPKAAPAGPPEGAAGGLERTAADYEREAICRYRAGQPARAAELYAIALALDPERWSVRAKLAACLACAGRTTDAARHYVGLARHYVGRRSPNDALAALHRLLELDPREFSYAKLSDIILAVGPRAVPVCRRAARRHREARRDELAADLLRICGQLDQHEVEAWRELAQLYFDRQLNREAAWALQQGARRLLASGNLREYVTFSQTVLWLSPSDLDTRRELSRALVQMGDPEQALEQLTQLMMASPGDPQGRETMAHAFALLGRCSASASVIEGLSEELVRSQRLPEADALLERARRWRPDDPEFVRRLEALPAPTRRHTTADRRMVTDSGTVILHLAQLTRPAPVTDPGSAHDGELLDATELAELFEPASTRSRAPVARSPRPPTLVPPPPRCKGAGRRREAKARVRKVRAASLMQAVGALLLLAAPLAGLG